MQFFFLLCRFFLIAIEQFDIEIELDTVISGNSQKIYLLFITNSEKNSVLLVSVFPRAIPRNRFHGGKIEHSKNDSI